jgi:hypothetical protein
MSTGQDLIQKKKRSFFWKRLNQFQRSYALMSRLKLVLLSKQVSKLISADSEVSLEAGDFSIDVRSNYPWLPTVWSLSLQRLDKKPFKFKARFVSYSEEDIRDYEQSREELFSKAIEGRETVSFSSWAAYHFGRWDVELLL